MPAKPKPDENPTHFKPQAGRIPQDTAKLVESIVSSYEPDAEFAPKSILSPLYQFMRALENETGKKAPVVEVAHLVEVNPFGAYRIRTVKGTAEMRKALEKAKVGAERLKRLCESGVRLRRESEFSKTQRAELNTLGRTKKFRENFDMDTTGNAFNSNPFQEYLPMLGGPFSRQLYLFDFLDMSRKAFEAWNHNPLAHQGVRITTSFVLGRGVTAKANSPLVQTRFDSWAKRIDLLGGRLENWSDMLSRDGELMVRKFINPMTRELFLRWVDPSTIWEIVTDLEDIEKVYYYHQQYPTQYQVLYGTGSQKSLFDPSKFEVERYVINQIPADELYHVKVNCSPNEKRGRSDLFSVLGWLKRYKDFLTGVVLRAIIQGTFAWKMKLKGTETDVQSFISQFGTQQPDFGSVHVENESATLEPMAPDMKGTGLDDAPGIVNMVAVGLGIPKEYLGFSEQGSRAGAIVASEPGAKKFMARQLLLGRFLKRIAQDWAENEQAEGRLPTIDPETKLPLNLDIEFQFPEIALEDRTAKIADIDTAKMGGYISERRAASMVAKELGIEGYDYDEEKSDIESEAATAATSLFNRQPPALGAPGLPPNPGKTPASTGGLGADEKRGIKSDHQNL